jgi:pyruvate/2-oxoglutarate dehydrogenase complex dihydrolipoamide acyltransferase (E2) component
MTIIDVLLPQSGMGMQDGEIIQWLKSVGDEVSEGEVIVEVEAAKVTIEVNAPVAGTLVEILAEEGEVKDVREVIAKISV